MKKNIWKKWWFWVILIGVSGLLVNFTETIDESNNNDINPDEEKELFLKSYENTIWEPDFISYPNDYHEDNPILKLVNVSDDGTVLNFETESGDEFTARICSGWDKPEVPENLEEKYYLQYKFDESDFFYGFLFHGCTPKSSFDEPTIMVDVKRGGGYTVIYKIRE